MSAPQLSLAPVKEPLGFIKVLEWIFSIFAFATCGGYSGKTSVQLKCTEQNLTLETSFAYPFRLNSVFFKLPEHNKCNLTWDKYFLLGNFSSSAQFFVTFAVLVFLYCIGALVLYLGYLHLYRNGGKLPLIDFAVTVLISFLWLVSTSAWAKALTDIKTSTGSFIVTEMPGCKNPGVSCHFNEIRSMGPLNVSVVIGFLNLILWAGNAWFVYKETSLHAPPATVPSHPSNPSSP
ncbi:synaptophysin-like protein 1 [Varanus komodoensis]|uniref:MARVEL domain-containing protein n=1 Tax=Varanus komodoensis TaxID=61221 RepID=A0A8D2J9G0_VARKO|nr:synaptophysin-like protein 1 [Varanus komodoensis]